MKVQAKIELDVELDVDMGEEGEADKVWQAKQEVLALMKKLKKVSKKVTCTSMLVHTDGFALED